SRTLSNTARPPMNGTRKSERRSRLRALLSACCVTFAAIASAGCTNRYVITDAEYQCKDWKHQTVSKHDKLTQETAEQIEANNLSRPAWGCKPGENRAGSPHAWTRPQISTNCPPR